MPKSTIAVFLLLLTVFSVLPSSPPLSAREIAPEQTSRYRDRYIVTFHDDMVVKGETRSGESSSQLAERLVAEYGGEVHSTYQHALNGFLATLPARAVSNLRSAREIASIQPEESIYLPAPTKRTAQAILTTSWGQDRIDQYLLPLDGTYTTTRTGDGVHVYVLDTGVDFAHPHFGGRVTDGLSFSGFAGEPNPTPDSPPTDGDDCAGHGTHVAGTIGSSMFGVANEVEIHSYRVLACDGGGSPIGNIINAMEWIMANHDTLYPNEPAVVNMSLGAQTAIPNLNTAVENLIAAGFPTVVAAGNWDNDACNTTPANVAQAITVGATNPDDERSFLPDWGWSGSFPGSNFGPCVDLFAPGMQITSTAMDGGWICASGGLTADCTGTSMAAPHVTGVIAMMLETHPNASPATLKSFLLCNTSINVLSNIGAGSPNLLLNSNAQIGFCTH